MAALGEPLLMTVEQFDLLPERQDILQELHWGSLVNLSQPKGWHTKLQMKLADLLRPLSAKHGYVVVGLPFRAVAQYELRAGDVAYVSQARWDAVDDGYLPGAPDLVIEVLSPSNTKSQVREYAAVCLANGCEEFWVIDHDHKTLTVTHKDGRSTQYSAGMYVSLGLFEGANLPVDSIFG